MTESKRIRLTAPRIEALVCPSDKGQVFLWDTEIRSLAVRVSKGGKKAFIFQGRMNNKSIRVTIGEVVSWSIGEARERAKEIQREVDQGKDPRQQKKERIAANLEKQRQEKLDKGLTLENLMIAYCDYLESRQRSAHKDVRSIVRNHINPTAFAKRPARNIKPEDVAQLMASLVDAGKLRTANKLRSYIAAAYSLAIKAKINPNTVKFKNYSITVNPAHDVELAEGGNKSGKNALDKAELIKYWNIIKDIPGVKGGVLRLHLLTGGQRVAQLVRLKSEDITDSTITIYDGKGSRRQARAHIIPLTDPAIRALEDINPAGDYALSTDNKTHVNASTVAKWAGREVNSQIDDFTIKRVRSGIETLLAANGWSKDLRGRLQSHGISGVQDVHYDAYEYLEEKRQMLNIIYSILVGKPAKILPIRKVAV